jgi:hypothetical protein
MGTLSGFNASSGTVTYTPAQKFGGTDTFTFHTPDGSRLSNPVPVTITVIRTLPTDTPTPTPKPTPKQGSSMEIKVTVTDNAHASEDLCGACDHDSLNNRVLTICWDLSESGISKNHGPFPAAGTAPVEFLPIVTVTDNLLTTTDLSNGQDNDPANATDLVIHWNLDPNEADINDAKNAHIYVSRKSNSDWVFLGKTLDATNYFVWNAANELLSDSFLGQGPQIGESYQFRVYIFTNSGTPLYYGYYPNAGPVQMVEDSHMM